MPRITDVMEAGDSLQHTVDYLLLLLLLLRSLFLLNYCLQHMVCFGAMQPLANQFVKHPNFLITEQIAKVLARRKKRGNQKRNFFTPLTPSLCIRYLVEKLASLTYGVGWRGLGAPSESDLQPTGSVSVAIAITRLRQQPLSVAILWWRLDSVVQWCPVMSGAAQRMTNGLFVTDLMTKCQQKVNNQFL